MLWRAVRLVMWRGRLSPELWERWFPDAA